MHTYILYKKATGEIIQTGTASSLEGCHAQAQDPENENILVNVEADDSLHYILDGDVVLRADLAAQEAYTITADGEDEVSFPLPAGTSVRFEGAYHEGEETFAFTSDTQGKFVFMFFPPFPYKPLTVTVTAE
jgi:hypothetical protein